MSTTTTTASPERAVDKGVMPKTTTAPATAKPEVPAASSVTAEMLRKKRSRKRLIQRIVIIVVLLGVAFGAYEFFKPTPPPTMSIRYAVPDRGDMVKAVTATGLLQAITTVQVGTQVSGTISHLYADFNSVVKKGQLLAQLDPILFKAQRDADAANLQQAQATLAYARIDQKRSAELLQQNLISPADFDVKRTAVAVDSGQVQQMKANLEKSTTNLGLATIISPVNGTIQSRNVDVGQTVAASLNAPTLFLIAEDLAKMWVAASVDEADIGGVLVGQDVKFTVEAYPGETFYGKVLQIRINPITQQNVVTYNVMITTDNTSGKLLPGMTATVSIILASRKDVLRVPTAALQFTPPVELVGDSAVAVVGKTKGAHTHGSGQRGSAPAVAAAVSDTASGVIYIKGKGKGQQIVPVKVTTGISDGASTEIISSNPPLAMSDSVVVGAFSSSPTSTGQPGATPFGATPNRAGPQPVRH